MRVLVFRRRHPIRLIRSWDSGVLQGDRASAREGTGILQSDHGTDQSSGPVSAADVALVLVVTLASLFGFVERARQVALETDNGTLHYMGLDLLGAGLTLVGCVALLWRRSFPGCGARGRHARHGRRERHGIPARAVAVCRGRRLVHRRPAVATPRLRRRAGPGAAGHGGERLRPVRHRGGRRGPDRGPRGPRRLGAGPGIPARPDPHPAARGPDPPARAAGPAPDPGAVDRRGAGRRPRTRQHRAGAARRGGQRRRHHRRPGRSCPTPRAARQLRLR